jgi:hypothetical protein
MPGENAAVDAGVDALNGLLEVLACIDGSAPFVYPYADVGYNAYQQRKNRRM